MMPRSPLLSPHPKILIRLPNWLGDVVMSTAFIAAVKETYPDAQVDVIIKKELVGIAKLIPGLAQIHLFSKQDYKGLQGVYRFGKMLRAEKYDLYFNLPTSLSSSVMAWATRAKKRVGFAKEGSFFLMTSSITKPVKFHRVNEYVSLLEQFTNSAIANRQVKLIASPSAASDKNTVIVNFNSEAESRRMPLDKAHVILNLLTKTFTTTKFILIGAPKEADFVAQVISGVTDKTHLVNFAGKIDLAGLCSLMAGSAVVLTTDSGPAHLANAVRTPTLVLFGAGNENNTAPYNKENLTVLRAGKLPCEPCVKNTCELYGVPKCMQLLDELQIINTLGLYLRHA
jgi:lipopolysaccharide heptosyltransferase II